MENTGIDNEFVSTRYGALRVAHFVSIKSMMITIGGQVRDEISRNWIRFKILQLKAAKSWAPGREMELANCKHVCSKMAFEPNLEMANQRRAQAHTHTHMESIRCASCSLCLYHSFVSSLARLKHRSATYSSGASLAIFEPQSSNKLSLSILQLGSLAKIKAKLSLHIELPI